jgi:hypothetical protein
MRLPWVSCSALLLPALIIMMLPLVHLHVPLL